MIALHNKPKSHKNTFRTAMFITSQACKTIGNLIITGIIQVQNVFPYVVSQTLKTRENLAVSAMTKS